MTPPPEDYNLLNLLKIFLNFEECISDERGPSALALEFMPKAKHLKFWGRVNRRSFGREKMMDDPFFHTFCVTVYKKTPSELWPKYKLAQPNPRAGWLNLMKYDKSQPTFDKKILDLAFTWADRHFSALNGSKVMDDPDSVKKEINMDASSGWPHNLQFKTKREFFDSEHAIPFCESYWEEIASDVARRVFWTNNVKEELRPAEKLAIGKLRTFLGSPVEHLWACIKLFSDQNEKLYSTFGQHWSFVGSSKFYQGWHKGILQLLRFDKGFALDESEYDSSLFRELWERISLFRFNKLCSADRTIENWHRVCHIYREVLYSLIVTGDGDVISKDTGGPSGFGNTIADNTILLYVLMAYAWIKMSYERFSHAEYEDFNENVSALLCGDDNTESVSEELDEKGDPIISWYNARSIAQVWTSLGVVTKTDDWEPRSVLDLDFLSHHTTTCFGEWFVPYPETDKVMGSMAHHNPSPQNPKWSLLRCNALRIESFFNPECKEILETYRAWLLHTEYDALHAPRGAYGDAKDIFSFEDVESVYKSDNELISLYISTEVPEADPAMQIYFKYLDVENLANPDKIKMSTSKAESKVKTKANKAEKKADKALKAAKKAERNTKRLEKAKSRSGLKTKRKGNGLLGYRNNGNHQYGKMTDAYIKTIVDPSQNAPVAIGFGSLTPGTLRTLYYRYQDVVDTTYRNGVSFVMNPWAAFKQSTNTSGANGANPSSALNYWVTQMNDVGSLRASTMSGYKTVVPANYSVMVADITEYRVVSAMIKVKLEYPLTSGGPTVFAGRVNGCGASSLDTFVSTNFFNLPNENTGFSKEGVCMAQINYLPTDINDFAYTDLSAVTSNSTGKGNPMYISLASIPNNTILTWEVIQHIETQSGTLAVASETASMLPKTQGALSNEWASPEQMWPKISPIIEKASDKVMFNVNDMLMSGAKWLGKHALSAFTGGISDVFLDEVEKKAEKMLKDPVWEKAIIKKLHEKEEKEREDFVPSTPVSGVIVNNASSVPALQSNDSYFSKFQFGSTSTKLPPRP